MSFALLAVLAIGGGIAAWALVRGSGSRRDRRDQAATDGGGAESSHGGHDSDRDNAHDSSDSGGDGDGGGGDGGGGGD